MVRGASCLLLSKCEPRGGAITPLLPANPATIARGKDEANGTKKESQPAIYQDAAESSHRHPGFGRNHVGGAAPRTSHSHQWRGRFRKDPVRTGVPGSGGHTIQRTRRVRVVRGIDPDLTKNAASLGFDLARLAADKKLFLDHVLITRSEISESGEYDLDGLFIRIADAVQKVGAHRVVLDTIESLFSELPNPGILRAEIRRLFGWLKEKGLTTVITAERDRPDRLTRHGVEEFVSDCVIVLDHRIREEISTRRLRIVKYRGSTHGTNEYPFLIDDQGISVLPISSLGLDHPAHAERISSGIARLDGMLGGKGFYRGSSILISGTSGTGKTSVAAHFVDAACRRGERCLYFAFEESPRQIVRNMRSIGIDLQPWVRKGLLLFSSASHLRRDRRAPVSDPQTHYEIPTQGRRG